VLSDLDIDWAGVETDTMYPRKLGDLFHGGQIALIGRYKNDNDLKNVTIALRGRTGKASRSFAFADLDFPLRNEKNDFLPRLWASRRVGWLIEQLRANGETKEVRDEIVDLGTRYGIVTPYTSYLATDGTFQALSGRAINGRFAPAAKSAPMSLNDRSGADAVQQSVQQNTMQQNMSIAADKKAEKERQVLVQNSGTEQFVGNKNFQNQNSVWIDTEYTDQVKLSEVRVKFGSDEYFDLVRRDPELARYFALGTQVVVVWKNNVYRVTE